MLRAGLDSQRVLARFAQEQRALARLNHPHIVTVFDAGISPQGAFIAMDPLKALVLFVLPMPIMYLGLLDNTYMQHSDLDTSSHFTASRNTTSRLYNLISWNLGYHTAHHLKPHVHWSRLPALHAGSGLLDGDSITLGLNASVAPVGATR